jgi:lipopolysaccharide export system permease protein
MLKLKQLLGQIDSIHMDERNLKTTMTNYTLSYANLKRFGIDTLQKDPDVAFVPFKDITDSLSGYDKTKRIQIMEIAMTRARNIKNFADVTTKQMEFKYRDYVNHMTEVYRKFTLSIACMVFFFIGAPLGSIIRRGGLGWPLFYSVIFFIIYHITSMAGEKLAESELLTVFGGMWLSTLVLLPIGFFLTLKASSDSKIYSADYYTGFMKRIFSFKNSAA